MQSLPMHARCVPQYLPRYSSVHMHASQPSVRSVSVVVPRPLQCTVASHGRALPPHVLPDSFQAQLYWLLACLQCASVLYVAHSWLTVMQPPPIHAHVCLLFLYPQWSLLAYSGQARSKSTALAQGAAHSCSNRSTATANGMFGIFVPKKQSIGVLLDVIAVPKPLLELARALFGALVCWHSAKASKHQAQRVCRAVGLCR